MHTLDAHEKYATFWNQPVVTQQLNSTVEICYRLNSVHNNQTATTDDGALSIGVKYSFGIELCLQSVRPLNLDRSEHSLCELSQMVYSEIKTLSNVCI